MSEKEIYESWTTLKSLFEDIEKDVLKFAVKKTYSARCRAAKTFKKMKVVIKQLNEQMLEEEKHMKIQKKLFMIERQKKKKDKNNAST